ncbi:MAG TPA: glycosyltransferase family 4 protein [Gemmatimonadaceae bacterium]|nr:glycosyltransferase family 4 protein [Gemmatimonadaceae bacterium]
MKIALIEPLGDLGIGTYVHELAEALTDEGVEVDVYSADRAETTSWPRKHRFFPVLGSALIRQRAQLSSRATPAVPADNAAGSVAASRPLHTISSQPPIVEPSERFPRFRHWPVLRDTYISCELAAWLRTRNYDLVWTHWPRMGRPLVTFWQAARLLGLRVVHTAHNVLPHEVQKGDYEEFKSVYRHSALIVTHSEMASSSLREFFPAFAQKVTTSRLGLFTTYPPQPGAREAFRREANVPDDSTIVLAFGSVRPYKNNELLLQTMLADSARDFTLVIAGHEFGMPGVDPTDPLAMTRRRVAELGLSERVRLLPGPVPNARASFLFEAADIVALPYTESYGSAVLLLAMSFGKCIVATRTGGMDEHLRGYPAGTIIELTAGPEELLRELRAARETVRERKTPPSRPPELEWPAIVRRLLPDLERAAR